MLRLYVVTFINAFTVLAANHGECAESRSEGLADLHAITRRWDDGVTVTCVTTRIALSGPAMNLQQLRRELDGIKTIEWAACHR